MKKNVEAVSRLRGFWFAVRSFADSSTVFSFHLFGRRAYLTIDMVMDFAKDHPWYTDAG